MALKDELEQCREDRTRRIEELEEAIDKLFLPQDGILAKMSKCVSSAKNRFNYVLGGIATLLALLAILTLILALVLDGIQSDAAAATTKAELVGKDVHDIQVENATLNANMKHMTETMQDLKKSLDQVNITLKELQTANHRVGPEKPK